MNNDVPKESLRTEQLRFVLNFSTAIRNVAVLSAQPNFKKHIAGLGCIALLLEAQLNNARNILQENHGPDPEDGLDFLLEMIETIDQLLEFPTSEKIENLIQRLDETFENIPQYLDKAPDQLLSLLQRFAVTLVPANLNSTPTVLERTTTSPPPTPVKISSSCAKDDVTSIKPPAANTKLACSSSLSDGLLASTSAGKRIKLQQPRFSINADTKSDGFSYPRKTAIPKNVSPGNSELSTSNAFAALDAENMETTEPANASDVTSASDKPMPIFILLTEDFRTMLSEIAQISEESFSKRVVDDLIKITPWSMQHHQMIENYLQTSNGKYYGMKPKANRPRKVVIRGLPADTKISQLKTEL